MKVDVGLEEMAPHSSILACKVSWTEEPGRLQSMGMHRDTTKRLGTHTHTHSWLTMLNWDTHTHTHTHTHTWLTVLNWDFPGS